VHRESGQASVNFRKGVKDVLVSEASFRILNAKWLRIDQHPQPTRDWRDW